MNGTATYRLPGASWDLHFDGEVLKVLLRHRQSRFWSREAVGQLYSRDLTQPTVRVDRATVMVPVWAISTRVQFDPARAFAEREALFPDGLHCIGFWHTHPEPNPTPSQTDIELARDHALAARSQLRAIVFVILGTAPLPMGLSVFVHDGVLLREAMPLGIGTYERRPT